jgi:23S rRNA (pseudouridine1915-N3)-methyltransferase
VRIDLLAVGQRMPQWIEAGFHDYAKRLNDDIRLVLTEIPAVKRTTSTNPAMIRAREAERIRKHLKKNHHIVMLDESGWSCTTHQLSEKLGLWRTLGQNVTLIIGGADGLDDTFINEAHETISLSNLTLPHGLVRVVVAEQIYRAWSILKNHPYHRE